MDTVNLNSVHFYYEGCVCCVWRTEFFYMTIEVEKLKINEQVRSLSFWLGEEGEDYDC